MKFRDKSKCSTNFKVSEILEKSLNLRLEKPLDNLQKQLFRHTSLTIRVVVAKN